MRDDHIDQEIHQAFDNIYAITFLCIVAKVSAIVCFPSSHCGKMYFSPAVFAASIFAIAAYSGKAALSSDLYGRATTKKTGFPPVSEPTCEQDPVI
jgi:hypothetical protein